MIDSSSVPITVRQPIRRSTVDNPLTRVQGVRGGEDTFDPNENKTVYGLWTNDYVRPSPIVMDTPDDLLASLGITEDLVAVFRCMLEDALIAPEETKQGKTIFDTALDIEFEGQIFEVTGTKRTGRPPVGPYELWVGLKKAGRS